MRILGLTESNAVGKKFKTSLIATENLSSNGTTIQSEPIDYQIVGVTPDTGSPVIYIPLIHLKELGLTNYSQVKIVVNNQGVLAGIRKQVEVMGFKTTSVVDTISQIEQLFSTLRLVLGLLGVVALAVAALGMFNTLTVSLLERLREVGMMKAIGMKSNEVRELFLTESMIMGFFGGIGGLLMGALTGKLLSLVLSVFSVIRGVGIIDISYVPLGFVFLIGFLSVFVGIATGVYPAKRATHISALNALRYE